MHQLDYNSTYIQRIQSTINPHTYKVTTTIIRPTLSEHSPEELHQAYILHTATLRNNIENRIRNALIIDRYTIPELTKDILDTLEREDPYQITHTDVTTAATNHTDETTDEDIKCHDLADDLGDLALEEEEEASEEEEELAELVHTADKRLRVHSQQCTLATRRNIKISKNLQVESPQPDTCLNRKHYTTSTLHLEPYSHLSVKLIKASLAIPE